MALSKSYEADVHASNPRSVSCTSSQAFSIVVTARVSAIAAEKLIRLWLSTVALLVFKIVIARC